MEETQPVPAMQPRRWTLNPIAPNAIIFAAIGGAVVALLVIMLGQAHADLVIAIASMYVGGLVAVMKDLIGGDSATEKALANVASGSGGCGKCNGG